MRVLYFDCFAGISGDMCLGAMTDLGVPSDFLCTELSKLNIKEYKLDFSTTKKNGITATKADVEIFSDNQEHHPHGRSYSNIVSIINKSSLDKKVKERALKTFSLLARAESKIHNIPEEDVHFHEIGAVDTIIDIVGAAICIEYLKPDKILCSTIELGGGFVECSHGTFPVPAPATLEILHGIPVKKGAVNFETTTPTGAAIIVANTDEYTDKSSFVIKKTGYGAGTRDMTIPNVLRVHIAESQNTYTQSLSMISECNIDDMNPEICEYVFSRLFNVGADDVYIQPIIMKKSRPAFLLSVLHSHEISETVHDIILKETTSLGLRSYEVNKTILKRESIKVETEWGTVRVKKALLNDSTPKYKAEYEDCTEIAKKHNIPISKIYDTVYSSLNK